MTDETSSRLTGRALELWMHRDGDFQVILRANLPLTGKKPGYRLRSVTGFKSIPLDGDPWGLMAQIAERARQMGGVSTVTVSGQEVAVSYLAPMGAERQLELIRTAAAMLGCRINE